jgi:multidrug resistance protein, MATE family
MNNIPLKKVLIFSLPIIAGQMGQMLFGTGDLLVAGRYSQEVVSALGVAATLFSPFLMLGLGITFAVSAITSRLKGEGLKENDMLFNSLAITTACGVILSIALYLFTYQLHFFQLIPAIEDKVISYIRITSFSLIPAILYQVYKEYLQSYGHTYVANGAILIFNGVNIVLNIVLMFGWGPVPELGINGAATATLITRFLMFVTLAIYTHKKFKTKVHINIRRIKEILSLGIPVGLSTLSEVLVFTAVTVLA